MSVGEHETTAPGLSGMRVVVVLAWSVLGGAERSALATATYLMNAGAHVEVLALTAEEGRGRDIFCSFGIPWHVQPVSWHGTRWTKATELAALARALRRLRPSVVLPYTTRPNVLCALVWKATGASLVVWNQQDVGHSTKFGRGLQRLAIGQTPLFVANSGTAARFLVSERGAPPENVHVVLECVEPSNFVAGFRDEWRSRLGIDGDTAVVSMLAHLHPVKDHATLLRAWRSVLDECPHVRAVLLLAGRSAGTGDSAKALAFDLGLGDSVRFLGDFDDVHGLLAASDIGVLTSRSESRPHALLESAAAGLPLVASDVPGIREIVGPDQMPYLVPAGDAAGFAAALTSLITNPTLRRTLGEQNRQRAAKDASEPGPAIAKLIASALTR